LSRKDQSESSKDIQRAAKRPFLSSSSLKCRDFVVPSFELVLRPDLRLGGNYRVRDSVAICLRPWIDVAISVQTVVERVGGSRELLFDGVEEEATTKDYMIWSNFGKLGPAGLDT